VEGKKEGLWVLMDYDHVIVHIFHEPVRTFYDIEGLWIDAKKIFLNKKILRLEDFFYHLKNMEG